MTGGSGSAAADSNPANTTTDATARAATGNTAGAKPGPNSASSGDTTREGEALQSAAIPGPPVIRPSSNARALDAMPFKLLTGNSNRPLAEKVAARLETHICKAHVGKFANKETHVTIQESVRKHDVYIMQSGCGSVNDMCMELFIMLHACRTASADRVVAVLPYFPYSKQSKQKKRGTIPAKLIATMLKTAGVTAVITMDLHHMQMQGFFDVPIDNVKLSPLLITYVRENVPNYKSSVVIVAKNAGASKRAALVAKRLKVDFAMIFGEQTKFAESLSEERLGTDGSQQAADAEVACGVQVAHTAAVEDDSFGDGIIGNVEGKLAILVDDLIDGAAPFVTAANMLQKAKAKSIYVMATHGILSANSPEDFEASCVDRLIVTNTIPQEVNCRRCSKLTVIDCTPVLAEAIRRNYNNESIAGMFQSWEETTMSA